MKTTPVHVTKHAHHTLKKLAEEITAKRGRFTSIKAVISALVATADAERTAATVNERAGLVGLGRLKRMAAEVRRMESEMEKMMGGDAKAN